MSRYTINADELLDVLKGNIQVTEFNWDQFARKPDFDVEITSDVEIELDEDVLIELINDHPDFVSVDRFDEVVDELENAKALIKELKTDLETVTVSMEMLTAENEKMKLQTQELDCSTIFKNFLSYLK